MQSLLAQALGKRSPRQRRDALDLIYIGHRHNSRYHWNLNIFLQSPVKEIIEDIVVKKHLGREKFTACFHFLFQIIQIRIHRFRFWMSFWIAGAANAEISE